MPHPDHSFDAVVSTLVLCTVADPVRALSEMRRVLRPGGRLAVLEHVRGTGRTARVQDAVGPLWTRMLAGCRLDRDTGAAIRDAGFAVEAEERFTLGPQWNPSSPVLQLTARR
ncbi:class I SAM-dependent methyltransferase [Pseudonocardia sp. HH130630-07]|uniref:class I SAM-dependent methyltransferase n=1 Tax=Pseudonocardia sp. HH130630-07 TaxID=1690815 RepID=UPI000AC019A1